MVKPVTSSENVNVAVKVPFVGSATVLVIVTSGFVKSASTLN